MGDVYQQEKVLQLPYVFVKCLSTRKNVKVMVCIWEMSINKKKC